MFAPTVMPEIVELRDRTRRLLATVTNDLRRINHQPTAERCIMCPQPSIDGAFCQECSDWIETWPESWPAC